MNFAVFLWLLVWGGIYTSIKVINSPKFFVNALTSFQGIRSLLPLFAVFLCLLKSFTSGSKRFPSFKTPLELLFYYFLIGTFGGLLSPDILTSMYWGVIYFSPISVIWYVMEKKNPLVDIRRLIMVNYIIIIIIMFTILKTSSGEIGRGNVNLPFGLGEVNGNGIARYALITVIFSLSRFINSKKMKRYLYLILIPPALKLLYATQSRTALFGLALILIVMFYIKGVKWYFFIVGPLFARLIWWSGFKLRAQSDFDKMIDLTGRQMTWQQGLDQIRGSPIYGWGFQADRLLLEFQHMHNSFFQALIQTGITGVIFFIGAFISIWRLIWRNKFFKQEKLADIDKLFIVDSVALITFFTERSFFESTAAFYGIDLFIIIPVIAYLQVLSKHIKEGDISIQK